MPRSVRRCTCTTPFSVCQVDRPGELPQAGREQLQDRERRRRLAAARLAGEAERLAALQLEGDAGDDLDVALAGAVADVQVVDAQDGIAHRSLRLRVGCVLDDLADGEEREHEERDREARRHDVPPRALVDRTGLEAVVEHRAPGERVRVAEAEVREARLAEHRERDDQHRVGPHDRHHVGQDVASHDPEVRGALRAGALDELALAQRQHLRAHDARRPRPAGDREHEHDDARAAAGDLPARRPAGAPP